MNPKSIANPNQINPRMDRKMAEQSDIRWQQRFENFQRAVLSLSNAIQLSQQRPLTDLEQLGLIQSFEFYHELAWKTLKDFLEYQGITDIIGSRDATGEAFASGLILDGDASMEMIKSRNLSSHTYIKDVADDVVKQILDSYAHCFNQFVTTLQGRIKRQMTPKILVCPSLVGLD
jgi:nucleotidyltransferase substrate binding protein (TIGR01987 family)